MGADRFLASMSTAEWVLNFALHSLLVLFIGWFFVRMLKRKSAPLRSKISFVTMLALLLLPFFSIAYQSFDIAFCKTSLPFTGDTRLSHSGVSSVETSEVITEHENPVSLFDKSAETSKQPDRLSIFFQSILSGITTANVINGVGIIWFTGFVLLLLRLLYGAASLRGFKKGLIKIKNARLDNILRQAQETFRFRSLPEVYASKEAKSPVVLGIARPRIVLPQKIYRKLSSKEIRGILFHELSHIYHRDQVTGVLQRIVTALYWWNPFVHTLSTDFSKAREEISDNHAIIGNNSREYAECLVNLAEKTALVNRLPFLRGLAVRHIPLRDRISQILSKERIMATETKKSTTLIIFFVFILSIGLITGYKWTFASDKVETKAEWTQDTEIEIQEEKAIEQEKELEQEKGKKEGEEKTLSAQEKEEIEKMLKELEVKLSAVKLGFQPVKIYVKTGKDGDKLVLAKDVCVSTQISEELKEKIKELTTALKLVKVDTDHKIHYYIEPVLDQEIALSEEQEEELRKKLEELKVKLSEAHVDVAPEISLDLKRDFKVDAKGKVAVEVKPVLVIKVAPEFPEEAKKKDIYGEVVVEGTTDKEGNVVKVKVLKSAHELLDKAVIEALKQWKYELPEYKGKTYAITFTVTVRFSPKDKDKDKDNRSWTVEIVK
jgi:TonB family protein